MAATATTAAGKVITPAQQARDFARAMKERRAAGRPINKDEFFAWWAIETGLTRKQLVAAWEAVLGLAGEEIGKHGPGVFPLPGIGRVKRVLKAATKARTVKSPFDGRIIQVPAKKARKVVRITPARSLGEML
jgi:hypothetical protein